MKKIKITIERSTDGTFWAYSQGRPLITGGGDTAEECKNSVLDCIETLKEIDENAFPYEEGKYQLIYSYDVQSLLDFYKGVFSKSALERLTGINQKQLHHYGSGIKKPRPAQKKKIETALHKLGSELLAVEL